MLRKVDIFILMIVTFGLISCGDSTVLEENSIVTRAKDDVLKTINKMEDGVLKDKLLSCSENPFIKTDFTIGHRGARLKFPEHTVESYKAAAMMGAGMLECDVTFTKDKELVCRHSQCDLHLTTNILEIPQLSKQCTEQFQSAEFNKDGFLDKKASAKCCTTDITLKEFKTLSGKIESGNRNAKTIKEYMEVNSTLYPNMYLNRGRLVSHIESIELFNSLGVKMIPEIKVAKVKMPFDGIFSQEEYIQKVINEYKGKGIDSKNVFIQSSNLNDILYLLSDERDFSKQAVYLYSRQGIKDNSLENIFELGVRYIGSPLWLLLKLENKVIVPSNYAKVASKVGLKAIAWTFSTPDSLLLSNQGGGWYYQSIKDNIHNEGDMIIALDVLNKDVGITSIFTDFPAITNYYYNCIEK